MYGEFNPKDILNRIFDVVLNRIKVDAQITGSKTEQVQVFSSQSVNAGATVISPWFDMSAFTRVAFAGVAEANHDWNLGFAVSPDGSTYGGNVVTVTGTATTKTYDVAARLNYGRISIKNNDTDAHTYNAWMRLFVST